MRWLIGANLRLTPTKIMRTITISKTYTLTHRLDETYYFTKDKRCFNVKRNTEVKRSIHNGSTGLCINRKFTPLSRLELIPIEQEVLCPF